MKTPSGTGNTPGASEAPETTSRGIAALFSDSERKALFRKYLLALGWAEIIILVSCWLYHMGTEGYDANGPINVGFPWRIYFTIAFLAPVATTFLLGTVIVGFNKFFSGAESAGAGGDAPWDEPLPADAPPWARKASGVVTLFRRLPFPGLLLLLGVGVGLFYNIEAICNFLGSVGEKTVRIVLVSGAVLLGVGVVFGLVVLYLNYRLKARSMEYQYKSQMAERFGLVILEDNTVLNGRGKLLVQGRKWKKELPVLPGGRLEPTGAPGDEASTETFSPTPEIDYRTS
jgi:hypothetical protein